MTILRVSLGCCAILLFVGLFHYRTKKMPLRSVRIFNWIYLLALVNILADSMTIIAADCSDIVPVWLNYAGYMVFLLSLSAIAYLLYWHVTSVFGKDFEISLQTQTIYGIPFLLSAILSCILPTQYIHTAYSDYTVRVMPSIYLLCVLFYLVLAFCYNFLYWKSMRRDKWANTFLSVGIFSAACLIQVFFPTRALMSVSVMIIVLSMMLGNENPQRYIDMQTGIFNQYALLAALDEWTKAKQEYYTGVIAFDSSLHGYWLFGAYTRYFQDVDSLLLRKFHCGCYRVMENGIVFLSEDEQEIRKALKEVETMVRSAPELYRSASLNLRTTLIPFRKEEEDYSILMQEFTAFCQDTVNKMDYLDLMTNVKNRNSFEMDWENIRAEDGELWYVIFDANNLKVVNDTYGHSQGDELLQSMATMLSEAVGLNGQVYRIGGDEFVALWQPDGNGIQGLLDNIKGKLELLNSRRSIPLEFATGYVNIWSAPDKQAAKDEADRMMYAVKREMKGEEPR